MSETVDLIGALAAFLKDDADVAALAGTNVWGSEVPRGAIPDMPRSAVVLSNAGGGLIGQGYQDYGDVRVDVDCYGTTPARAERLHRAVYGALKHLRATVTQDVLIHWARPSAKAIDARDPDTDWPMTVSSWQVLASEVAAT